MIWVPFLSLLLLLVVCLAPLILLWCKIQCTLDSKSKSLQIHWTRFLKLNITYISYRAHWDWYCFGFQGSGDPTRIQLRPSLRAHYRQTNVAPLRAYHRSVPWQQMIKCCKLEQLDIRFDPGNAALLEIITPISLFLHCIPNIRILPNSSGVYELYFKLTCLPIDLIFRYFTKSRNIRY